MFRTGGSLPKEEVLVSRRKENNRIQEIKGILSSLLFQILDKLLDRESQTHKPQTLSSFYSSSRPATASQRSPSKHGGPSAPGALQPLTSGSAGPAQPGSVTGAGPGPTEGFTEKNVPGEVGALGRGDEWYGAMLGSPFPGSSQCPIFPTRQFPTFPLRGSPI